MSAELQEKAARLHRKGAVRPIIQAFEVEGDTGTYTVGDNHELKCNCRAAGFGNECSHRLAVELSLELAGLE